MKRNEVFDLYSSVISSARPLKLEQHIKFINENLVSRLLWICGYFKGIYLNVSRSFNNINYSFLCIHFQEQPMEQVFLCQDFL